MNNEPRIYKVMLVDDSSVVRDFLKGLLSEEEEIQIVAEAENGQVALEKAAETNPDTILLDIEMPVMDGITALPKLLQILPECSIIMVSSLTKKHAEVSIKALAIGADDFMEKPTANTDKQQFANELIKKIKLLSQSNKHRIKDRAFMAKISTREQPETKELPDHTHTIHKKITKPKALAIGCSTGGPAALNILFRDLNGKITDIPIFITQHMPPTFTTFLADNISKASSTKCIEAKDNMKVENGVAYLAPGDYHMTIAKPEKEPVIKLNQDEPENFCRPSVNPMLRSLVDIYGDELLVIIMTGMGSDGIQSVRYAFEKRSYIIIQDETTSVVWGMPGVVAKEQLYNQMLPLNELSVQILKIYNGEG